jgi:hypothetical protein
MRLLTLVIVATVIVADECAFQSGTRLLVPVLDSPASQLMQALQSAIVGCPCGGVEEAGDLVVPVWDVEFREPFRASVGDGPVVIPALVSSGVARWITFREQQVHIEHKSIRVIIGLYDVSLDLFDGCVNHHVVSIPIRHMQIG